MYKTVLLFSNLSRKILSLQKHYNLFGRTLFSRQENEKKKLPNEKFKTAMFQTVGLCKMRIRT